MRATMRNTTRLVAFASVIAFLGATAVVGSAKEAQKAKGGKHAALLAKVDTIAAKVGKLRGLRVKRKIKRGVMGKAQIRARLLKRIDQEYSAKELAAESVAMKRFGLLPVNTNYKKLVIDLLTDQIAGFYDPWEKTLYIAGWQQTGAAAMSGDMIMAHEIDHALQDQHFGLKRFMRANKSNGDASVARQAVVEGDGMALMVEYAMGGVSPWANDQVLKMMGPAVMQQMTSGKMAKVPLAMREGLIFPYLAGIRFIAHFRKSFPWSRVNRIYRRPPLSTEHILHPEKYTRYERPDRVLSIKQLRGAGLQRLSDNVSGELGLSLWLRQHGVARARADRAAAGWGGDRTTVYSAGGKAKLAGSVGVIYSVWDHEADAIEFQEAARDATAKMMGGTRDAKSASHVTFAINGGVSSVERRKKVVVVMVDVPDKAYDKTRAEVWRRWRVR